MLLFIHRYKVRFSKGIGHSRPAKSLISLPRGDWISMSLNFHHAIGFKYDLSSKVNADRAALLVRGLCPLRIGSNDGEKSLVERLDLLDVCFIVAPFKRRCRSDEEIRDLLRSVSLYPSLGQ